MKREQDRPEAKAALRRAAEARLKEKPATQTPQTEAELRRLQHELEVHQVELEMQNEELRRTKVDLEAALGQYTELYDLAPVGYLTLKPDGTIQKANLAAASLLGVERSRLLRRRFGVFFAPESRAAFNTILSRAFGRRIPEVGEVGLVVEGEPPLVVRLHASVLADGQECRMVLTDFTKLRQAEAELRDSEERYRGLFEAEPDAVLMVDQKTGEILEANTAALKLYGYDRAEILALRGSDLSAEPGATRQAIRSRVTRTWLHRHRRKEGTVFPVEISGNHFCYRGRHTHVAVIRDITERKQAKELRLFSGRLLRLRDEERRRLARELHDSTGQNLAAIMVNLSFLRTVTHGLKPEARQALLDALALTERTAKELRTLTYLLHPPLLEELGLPGVVRDFAAGFARRSGIRVDLELAPEWRRMPEEIELALFRVIQESLSNILKHSGSESACVTLRQAPEAVHLEVRDAGHGFTLGDPGVVGPAPSPGVGIPGMSERLRELGGLLEITSSSGGTIIRATLPIVPTASGNPP